MIPSTLLQAKIGNIKWLSYLVGGIGVMALLMATVHGADALIIMRFLIGLIAAGITPGTPLTLPSTFFNLAPACPPPCSPFLPPDPLLASSTPEPPFQTYIRFF